MDQLLERLPGIAVDLNLIDALFKTAQGVTLIFDLLQHENPDIAQHPLLLLKEICEVLLPTNQQQNDRSIIESIFERLLKAGLLSLLWKNLERLDEYEEQEGLLQVDEEHCSMVYLTMELLEGLFDLLPPSLIFGDSRDGEIFAQNYIPWLVKRIGQATPSQVSPSEQQSLTANRHYAAEILDMLFILANGITVPTIIASKGLDVFATVFAEHLSASLDAAQLEFLETLYGLTINILEQGDEPNEDPAAYRRAFCTEQDGVQLAVLLMASPSIHGFNDIRLMACLSEEPSAVATFIGEAGGLSVLFSLASGKGLKKLQHSYKDYYDASKHHSKKDPTYIHIL